MTIGKVTDKIRAEFYNSMIERRENEIAELQRKISDCREYDKVYKQRQQALINTSVLLDSILSEGRISDANLRMLVNAVTVHQNENKLLDMQFEINGDFINRTMIVLEPMFNKVI